MALQAGVAAVDITPPVGTWLAGFAGRDHGSEGIHDPLRSKALVLDDGASRVCIITNDLIGLRGEVVCRVRDEIERTTGIPGGNVLVNCSHTHSGPQIKAEEDYTGVLVRKIAGAAKMAADACRPARLGSARGPVQVGINRRELRDGEIVLGRDPSKPVAPYVDVIRVDSEDGSPLAILFAHACHAVTRGQDSYLISADYPGHAQGIVEAVHPGATAMFAQGCSGNINSEPVGGSFEDVRRLGTMLAGETLKVRELAATADATPLAVAHETVALPSVPIPDLETCEAEIARYEDAVARAEAEGNVGSANSHRAFRDTWTKLRDLKQRGEELPPLEFPLQGIAIGDTAILGLPGEVFVEYALHAEAVSPFRQTLTLGCTNGALAYVPTSAALPEGGYEVSFTPLWWGRLPFAPQLEPILQDGLTRLLQGLHTQTTQLCHESRDAAAE